MWIPRLVSAAARTGTRVPVPLPEPLGDARGGAGGDCRAQAPQAWPWWQGQLLCPQPGQPQGPGGAAVVFEQSREGGVRHCELHQGHGELALGTGAELDTGTLGMWLEKGHLLAGDCEG